MANELYFDIRLALNDSDERTVKERLNTIHREANEASQGSTEAKTKETKATQAQANAEKELIKEFQRKVTLNEVQFRQGKLSQKAALEQAEAIERQAIEQGILTNETLQGVRAQKTMFLSQQRISTGFTGLARESATANMALMNMGRIVQDLPFGFLGISNNIDPALNSFQSLREEVGGTGNAIRMLIGSLAGSGGLIFMLGSVLPSAVLIATQGFNMYRKAAGGAGDETERLTDSVDRFISQSASLRDLGSFSFLDRAKLAQEVDEIHRISPALNQIREAQIKLNKMDMVWWEKLTISVGEWVQYFRNWDDIKLAHEQIKNLSQQFGVTTEQVDKFFEKLEATNAELRIMQGLAQHNPLGRFQEWVDTATDEALADFNTGLVSTSDRLQSLAGYYNQAIIDLRRGDTSILAELGLSEEDVRPAIAYLQSQLKELSDFVPKKPVVPIIPPKDEIIDNFNELNLLLSDAGIEPIDIEIYGENFEQDAKDRAAVLAQISADATAVKLRDLDLQRKAFKALKSDELETARYVARQKVMLERNVMGALQSLSQGFAQDNKALAIGLLAIEKGLAIAQVIINGIKESAKASALAASWTAMGRFDMAGIATGMAVKIKALTAANVAAIAAQGIGEAVNISNRGSRSGGMASGGAGNEGQYGFFTSDREPKRPSMNQPINVYLEGEFDDEVVSVKARRGDEKRKRGTFFTV